MSVQIGDQLAWYEITSLLGKGGMGEVYRARDTKLKRDVAIKILPDEFSSARPNTPKAKPIPLSSSQSVGTRSDLPATPRLHF